MKKMTMIVAAVLIAGISQAAYVNWNSGAIKVPNPDGTFGANVGSTSGIYNALVTFWADDGGSPGDLVVGVTGTSDSSTSALSVLNGTTAGTVFTAGVTYWAQIAIWTTDGNYEMTSAAAAFVEAGTGNSTLNFLTGAGFVSATNKLPTEWTVVPEPTSMALLGLGVAALGLRRKFRK